MEKSIKNLGEIVKAMLNNSGAAAEVKPDAAYDAFLKNETETDESIREKIEGFEVKPFFSVVLRDGGDDNALVGQLYGDYELVRSGDAIRGDFVISLERGDTLAKDALFRFAQLINDNANADCIFANEDTKAKDGARAIEYFKPEYSETTLLSVNSLGAAIAASKRVYSLACAELDGTADGEYAYALMCALHAKEIRRIDRVLMTRAKGRGGVTAEGGKSAINSFLQKKGDSGFAAEGLYEGSFRVMRRGADKLKYGVVVANKNNADGLRRLLESIESGTFGCKYAVVIADGGSKDKKTLRYYELLESSKAARIAWEREDHYSKLCNAGAGIIDCDKLLFMTGSVEVISTAFIKTLSEACAERKNTAVGAKILCGAKKSLQNAGYTIGIGGFTESLYLGSPNDAAKDARRQFYTETQRNVSAVSGDCLMIDTETFHNIGGFDESYKRFGADVELCVRLYRSGGMCVYTPYCEILRHSPPMSVYDAPESDKVRLYDAIRPLLVASDPFFSMNYDCASVVPVVSNNPTEPIKLNKFCTM